MREDLVTGMLPVLGRSLEPGFNVFDVMHHGRHEKQISNVFRWLLEREGTHGLGERFVRIFIDEVNQCVTGGEPFPVDDGYWIQQEVNTSNEGEVGDVADLVLESRTAVLVVENYFTSDGHGHSYHRYLSYAQRDGRRGLVVLLCRDRDSSLQTLAWEHAPVLTYGRLTDRLLQEVSANAGYRRKNPDAYAFIEQMHSKFVKGRGRVEDHDVLKFVTAMCTTGEARRYQEKRPDVAAEQFATDLAAQARERFGEGRELLLRAKGRLKSFGQQVLAGQLNETLGEGFVRGVNARYAGIYQWTVNFDLDQGVDDLPEAPLQLKFGPSAWFANEQDPYWKHTIDPEVADYSRLFITSATSQELRQSAVTLQEVLDGLEPTDRRLHDEIMRMLNHP